MDIYTERKALEEHIKWIREERRRLSEEYWKSIDRLKQLDKEASSDITNDFLSMFGDISNKQMQIINTLSNLVPKVSPQEVIEHIRDTHNVSIELEEQVDSVISKEEVIKSQEDELGNKRIRQNADLKTLSYKLANYLKERGVPVKLSEIAVFLKNNGYNKKNPTTALLNMMSHNDRIVKASRGYYQYK